MQPARIGPSATDGERVIAVGTTAVFRLRLDREAARLTIDERWRPSYGPAPGRSYGWDPEITDAHVLWMDNGRNRESSLPAARPIRGGSQGVPANWQRPSS
jgi:hypothetical protein